MFVDCIPSGTRRISDLPSAALKTLGKKNTRQNRGFAECKKTLGNERVCRVSKKNTREINKIFFLLKKEKKKNKKTFVEC